MGQDLCDLGMTAAAVDARHQLAEPLRFGDPGRGAAFRQTAKIDKLDGAAADGGRLKPRAAGETRRRPAQRQAAAAISDQTRHSLFCLLGRRIARLLGRYNHSTSLAPTSHVRSLIVKSNCHSLQHSSRRSPDNSQSRMNIRAFPAFLQHKRKARTAFLTRKTRACDLLVSPLQPAQLSRV